MLKLMRKYLRFEILLLIFGIGFAFGGFSGHLTGLAVGISRAGFALSVLCVVLSALALLFIRGNMDRND
jgi:glucose uptake protein GlcU